MIAALERRWTRLTGRRDRMLAELGTWSADELRASPGQGRWSALEVVDHLVRSDREVLRMVEDGRGTQRAIEWRDRVRAWMVLGVMWLPTRVSMPKAVEAKVTPAVAETLPGLREEWERVDSALHACLAGLSEGERRAGVARHPVSGWLNAHATVRFLEAHLIHHEYQFARIRRAVRALA